jgi:hypothetical protein
MLEMLAETRIGLDAHMKLPLSLLGIWNLLLISVEFPGTK